MTDETLELLLCPECDKERAFSCNKSFCGYEEALQEKLRTVGSERDAALSRVERLEGALTRVASEAERCNRIQGGASKVYGYGLIGEIVRAALSPPVESEYPPEQI